MTADRSIFSFEQVAQKKMLRMSDGSSIRILRHGPSSKTDSALTLVFICGWGAVVESWDLVMREFAKHFDLIYVETREKQSSELHRHSVNNLNRQSEDLCEIVTQLGLNNQNLVIFGSSWGGVITAKALAHGGLKPHLAVLTAPIGRLGLPFGTRYLMRIAPVSLMNRIKPLARQWLIRFRSETAEQAATYLRILDNADFTKWKSISRHVVLQDYWPLYEHIRSETLVIAVASGDKFHTANHAKRIAQLCGGTLVSVRDVAEKDSPKVVELVLAHIAQLSTASREQ